jgi:hypothetical protein
VEREEYKEGKILKSILFSDRSFNEYLAYPMRSVSSSLLIFLLYFTVLVDGILLLHHLSQIIPINSERHFTAAWRQIWSLPRSLSAKKA